MFTHSHWSRFAALIALSLPLSWCIGATTQADDRPIPLHVAIQKGLVDVQVVGRGASTGDSVQVRVQRKGGADVRVSVDPGTVIQPQGTSVQSMALAGVRYKQVQGKLEKAEAIELTDDQPQTYILEGYCRDIEKPTPKSKDSFTVAGPDAENAKVLVQAKKLGATVKVTQSAIWIQRSKLSDDELKKYFQVTSDELDAARKLLVSVERGDGTQDVDVKVVLDRIRQFAERNAGTGMKRGDTIEIVADDVEFRSRLTDKPLGKLKKGTQYEVLGVTADSLVVRAEIDDEPHRGLIKQSDVKLIKSADRPLLGAVLKAAEEVRLEVFDKVDVQVGADR